MIRLDRPSYSFQDALRECESGIPTSQNILKKKIQHHLFILVSEGLRYESLALSEYLHTYPATPLVRKQDPVILGTLKKSELTDLYDDYLSGLKKPARHIYDDIKLSSGSMCPLCCGVNPPNQVDHFLPKAHFPQFSVYPDNLIPTCEPCNTVYKMQFYALTAPEQIIQPYFDGLKFFNEQWVFGEFIPANGSKPDSIQYYVQVPEHWSDEEEFRVNKHFELFHLAVRYSEKAAQQLETLLEQIRQFQDSPALDNELILHTLIQPGINKAPYINHWQRGMYMAVKEYLLSVS